MYKNEKNPMCPEGDFTCPYIDCDDGHCKMFEKTGSLPYKECDEFFAFWEDDYDECGFDPYQGCCTFDC